MFTPRPLTSICLLIVLLSAYSIQYPEACSSSKPVGLIDAQEIASNESLPFRFPLDESIIDEALFFGWFSVSNECTLDIKDCYEYSIRQFHAAEDYKRTAGTPVYAMADGRISFSGTAGGYGWLILIDHPQANLYSLYGHLSPSRWKLKVGTEVKRGDLIAYLGDPDENGGSVEEPLEPHLHFGIRAGQTADYPARGEWRYMAGWIRSCPQDLGWLQPSLVITSQEIPAGGYTQPKIGFLNSWGYELLLTSIYTIGGLGMIALAVWKRLRYLLIFPGIIVIAAGIVFHSKGMVSTFTLLAIGLIMAIIGIVLYLKSKQNCPRPARTIDRE